MPCGGGSKHVLPPRAWLMTTSGSTGRRWKRRYTAIATEKIVRFARDQIGATETANNCISIESDRGARAVDFIADAMACAGTVGQTQAYAAERTHPNDVDLARRSERKLHEYN